VVRGFHSGRGAVVAVTVLLRVHVDCLPLVEATTCLFWMPGGMGIETEGELKDPSEHFPYFVDVIVVCKQKQIQIQMSA
jgi:hypothetical protein